MPQDFPVGRIEGDKVPERIAGEKQVAGGGQHPCVKVTEAGERMLPGDLTGLRIDGFHEMLLPQTHITPAVALRPGAGVGQVVNRIRMSRVDVEQSGLRAVRGRIPIRGAACARRR